jgi:hypothetical protein
LFIAFEKLRLVAGNLHRNTAGKSSTNQRCYCPSAKIVRGVIAALYALEERMLLLGLALIDAELAEPGFVADRALKSRTKSATHRHQR